MPLIQMRKILTRKESVSSSEGKLRYLVSYTIVADICGQDSSKTQLVQSFLLSLLSGQLIPMNGLFHILR